MYKLELKLTQEDNKVLVKKMYMFNKDFMYLDLLVMKLAKVFIKEYKKLKE